jgi:hypothetical protein
MQRDSIANIGYLNTTLKYVRQKQMNTKMILSNLNEGLEQLQQTIEEIKRNPEYGIEEYRVEMGHLYHHLNTAWNGRDATEQEYKECADASFNRWRKFPKEDELYLDTEI